MKINLLTIFAALSINCFSQDSLNFNHNDIGIGADILSETFYFPVFINKNIKIEPELRMNLSSDGTENYDYKSLEIGSGIFYTLNYKHLVPYFGFRIGYSYVNNQYSNNDFRKESGFYIGPILGGEYFLFERFSIGIELLSRYTYLDGTRTYREEVTDINRRDFNTYTYVIIRVYLL